MATTSSVFTRVPRYQRIRHLFGPELAGSLLEYAVANRERFGKTLVGADDGARSNVAKRVSTALPDFGALEIEVERRMRDLFPALSAEMQVNPFELYSLELELVAHGDGAFYGRHIDTLTRAQADTRPDVRILSGVYYFHSQPKAFSGGALRLYAMRAQPGAEPEYLDIEPEHDMLLVFPSFVPHEVRKVSCSSGRFADSRFAINCWFCGQAAV